MTETTLINLRTYRGPVDYVLIDRRTPFGNQYVIGAWSSLLGRRLTREDAVALFWKDFDERIKTDPAYRARVETLRCKKIACWCTPLECHGDVYVEYFKKGANE